MPVCSVFSLCAASGEKPALRSNAWRKPLPWVKQGFTHGELDWLLDEGSLTHRLENVHNAKVVVELVREGVDKATREELLKMGTTDSRFAWIREVELSCAGKPVVFARTVIPLSTLTGPERQLTSLGNRPLGAFLFNCPSLRRVSTDIATFGPTDPFRLDYEAHLGLEKYHLARWLGRRSLFSLNGKPLLVGEIFLPQAPIYGANQKYNG